MKIEEEREMTLTKRDKLIIETLKRQDFCFYKDIQRRFFCSAFSASRRLNYLKQHGYILIEPFSALNFKNSLDQTSLEAVGQNSKFISLSDKCHALRRNTSPWKRTHQLLLFSVRERLERLLEEEAVFENQIRNLRHTLYDRAFEPYPDFYLKAEDFKLAVELELHLKSRSRYALKMSEYRDSSYSHVLYVVTDAKKINRLIRIFQHRRYIGISHYSKVEEMISYRYGEMPLLKWLRTKVK